jgi:hypothetical protein
MSASGPKRTSLVASHMSAFGDKADMAFCGISLSRLLLGVKRTWVGALQVSAFDQSGHRLVHRTSTRSGHGGQNLFHFGGSESTQRLGANVTQHIRGK